VGHDRWRPGFREGNRFNIAILAHGIASVIDTCS